MPLVLRDITSSFENNNNNESRIKSHSLLVDRKNKSRNKYYNKNNISANNYHNVDQNNKNNCQNIKNNCQNIKKSNKNQQQVCTNYLKQDQFKQIKRKTQRILTNYKQNQWNQFQQQNCGWQHSPQQNQQKLAQISLFKKFQMKINSFQNAYKKQNLFLKSRKNKNKQHQQLNKNKKQIQKKHLLRNYIQLLDKQNQHNDNQRSIIKLVCNNANKNKQPKQNSSLKVIPYLLPNESQKQDTLQQNELDLFNKNFYMRCKQPSIGFNHNNFIDSQRNNLRSKLLKNKFKNNNFININNCLKSKTQTKFDSFFINFNQLNSHTNNINSYTNNNDINSYTDNINNESNLNTTKNNFTFTYAKNKNINKRQQKGQIIRSSLNNTASIMRPNKAYSSLSSQTNKRPQRKSISYNKTNLSSTSVLNNIIFHALNQQLQKKAHSIGHCEQKIFNFSVHGNSNISSSRCIKGINVNGVNNTNNNMKKSFNRQNKVITIVK